MTERTEPDRGAILAGYRPIRASIQAVLARAVEQCRKPDFDRAAKHLDLIDQEQLDDEQTFAMLCDIALFEPNQRGRRVVDGFLTARIGALDPADRDTARRFASAFFSIFRVAGWHAAGGVWLENLLTPGRKIWLMDENLEASAPEGVVTALRVFDAGPFHAGFGIVVRPDAEAVSLCTDAALRSSPPPFRHSLAAALYGDAIAEASLVPIPIEAALAALAAIDVGSSRTSRKPGRARSKRRPR